MKRKICFIQDGLGGGGAEHVIVNLANELIRIGYDVEIALYENMDIAYKVDEKIKIISLNRKNMDYDSCYEKYLYLLKYYVLCLAYNLSIIFLGMASFFWEKPYIYIKGRKKSFQRKYNRIVPINKFIKKRKDAVIISFMVHCYVNVAEALYDVKPYKFLISERDDPNAVQSQIMINKRKNAMKLADVCVFQTDQALEYMKNLFEVRGVVIPNPINIPQFNKTIKNRKKIVVNYCRLNSKKNLPLLINAFEKLSSEFEDYKLYIYGKGELENDLRMLIDEKKLKEKVKIFDFDPNIHEIVQDYSMFVSSSDYEGISNSMIEAMALGLPVVCTDCPIGGASMFIKNFENGILTPVGNVDALYEAMKYIIMNPEKANDMGNNAKKIQLQLNVNFIVSQWEQLF